MDPSEAAEAAGLRYVNDNRRGIRRLRSGKGFAYRDADGRWLRDRAVLDRIRSLALPPAWTDLWICSDPRGHLQATGRDNRGRKQYRYHPRWRAIRDATKYDRLLDFAQALPRIRARVQHDLDQPGLPRNKVLATVVRLLETTLIRIGNEEYARHNGSFGLTTLHNHHANVNGSRVRFTFRGKSGIRHSVNVKDRRLARIIQRCQELPGHELFEYVDDDDAVRSVDSADVNDYLREVAGSDFTAKDFRTWAGTVLAAQQLAACEQCTSLKDAKANVVRAIDAVAERLRNTRAVCRKCYVHPAIVNAYLAGELPNGRTGKKTPGLRPEEAVVVAILEGGSKGPKLRKSA